MQTRPELILLQKTMVMVEGIATQLDPAIHMWDVSAPFVRAWIRDELGPKTAISLMAQYYATNKAATDERYILLSRRISEGEWFEAVSLLEELGMEEGFMQEYESASHYYRPDFTDAEKPFKDIRDFQ